MLSLPDRHPIYLVMDAFDECPDTSGISLPRERVLQLVKEHVEFPLSDLHVCVMSRPEVDIQNVLEPLASLQFSFHNHSRQKRDLLDYVNSIVYSQLTSTSFMSNCKPEHKNLVIKTLSERVDGCKCIPSRPQYLLNFLNSASGSISQGTPLSRRSTPSPRCKYHSGCRRLPSADSIAFGGS